MAFKLAQKPAYTVTAKIFTPKDGDGFDESSLKVKFKRVNFDELDALRKKTQKEVVKEVLVDFSELLDETNQPVPFNEENLDELLSIPQALQGIAEAFWSSIFKAKEKN